MRELTHVARERRHDGIRISAGYFDEGRKPRPPFNQGHDVAVLRARDQVALPMARNGSVFDLGGRSLMETAPIIWPRDCASGLKLRERRVTRLERRCPSSCFFSTPRAWMNKLR